MAVQAAMVGDGPRRSKHRCCGVVYDGMVYANVCRCVCVCVYVGVGFATQQITQKRCDTRRRDTTTIGVGIAGGNQSEIRTQHC